MSDLDKATRICCEYLARRPGIRGRLTDQVDAGLRSQDIEGTRSVGVTIDDEEKGPRVTDTTGEAAIRVDRARRLLSELDHAESDLLTAANTLIGHPMLDFSELTTVIVRHGQLIASDIKKSAKTFDRALGEVLGRKKPDPGKAHDGRPGCGCCARLVVNRIPWFSEPTYNKGNPTDLGGQLPKPYRLCDPCYRHAIKQEPTRLATVAELKHRYHDPRNNWPPERTKARR